MHEYGLDEERQEEQEEQENEEEESYNNSGQALEADLDEILKGPSE